jgi:hypothetical protein
MHHRHKFEILFTVCYLLSKLFDSEDSRYVSPKYRVLSRLHGVITQKKAFLKIMVVTTPDLSYNFQMLQIQSNRGCRGTYIM